jgi:hypothetical protein
MAHDMPFPHFGALRHFFTHSHGGHYTPFAYYAEVELSYVLGPREPFWKWRQLNAVIFLAVSLSFLAYTVARIQRVPPLRAGIVAGSLTSLFVFQPLMRELVASPLLALQITAGSLFSLTVLALLKWVGEPTRKRWIWLATAVSYLSVHFVGYGLATVLATLLIFSVAVIGIHFGRLPSFVSVRRTLIVCLISLLVLTGIHAILMEFLLHPPAVQPNGLPVDVKSVLIFLAALFFSAIHGLVSFDPPASYNGQLPPNLWPWGLLLLIIAATSLIWLARSCVRRPTAVRFSHFVLHCFSVVAFCVFVLMCAARLIAEPSPTGFHNYLLGTRYVVPANLLLFGSFAVLAATIARRAGRVASVVFVLLAVTALLGSREFSAGYYKQMYSVGSVSQGKAWRAMVTLAKQCRAANLPVPNVPMAALTFEFRDWDLKLYAPLLRYSLGLPRDAKIEFEQWEKVCGPERARYESAAPALRQVIALLHLQVPPG